MEKGERLDIALVNRGIFSSRQRAKYGIEKQIVYLNGKLVEKSSKLVYPQDQIEIKGEDLPYVSRGGLKLKKALEVFQISLKNKICVDIGASTGGFTDCMLQHGAEKIYAIDVGHNQLDKKLEKEPKVHNIEGMNIKEFDANTIEKVDFACTDVSFIPVEQVLPKIYELLKMKGLAVILIKPQFEAGRNELNKHGVVKDKRTHEKVVLNVIEAADKVGFKALDLDFSPIKGPAGNIEYLFYMQKDGNKLFDNYLWKQKIKDVVEQAYRSLK